MTTKRWLGLVFVFCAFAAANVHAAQDVRAAQSRLKEHGFFYGEVNGVQDEETAAALTRYQIRNGLPITGKLDPGTSKHLGVDPADAKPAAPAQGEAWRRLRKTDEQFLNSLESGAADSKRPASRKPAQAPRVTSPKPATAARPNQEPASAPRSELSRERLRDYVAAFVLAGLAPGVEAEIEFFAPKVDYFDSGRVSRETLRADLRRYNERWPHRRFWLAGDLDVTPQPDGRLRVSFPLRYELGDGEKKVSGKVRKTLVLEKAGEDLEIVSIKETRAR